jgi:hypothetical protein
MRANLTASPRSLTSRESESIIVQQMISLCLQIILTIMLRDEHVYLVTVVHNIELPFALLDASDSVVTR